MIPKIIHYCWFSGEPMPPEVLDCIASWRRFCPDWELRLWDMDAIRDIDNRFMREALSVKKWAFAADYVRVYAVERYGGVYLDTDVKIIAPIDHLLNCRFFIGREYLFYHLFEYSIGLSSHCFGGEAGHPFLRDCLTYYKNRPFIFSTSPNLPDILNYDLRLAPDIKAQIASFRYGYNSNPTADFIQEIKEGMIIYPSDVFPRAVDRTTKNTLTLHFTLASWGQKLTKSAEIGYQTPPIPLWRKLIGALRLRDRFVNILRRLGYIAVRID